MGGSLHPRLNIDETPIAKKYREGKMKSTSKGELKEPEIVGREAFGHLSSCSSELLQRHWFHEAGGSFGPLGLFVSKSVFPLDVSRSPNGPS